MNPAKTLVLITGASRGLGRQLAHSFAARGYRVVVKKQGDRGPPTDWFSVGGVDSIEKVLGHGSQGVEHPLATPLSLTGRGHRQEVGAVFQRLGDDPTVVAGGKAADLPRRLAERRLDREVAAPHQLAFSHPSHPP